MTRHLDPSAWTKVDKKLVPKSKTTGVFDWSVAFWKTIASYGTWKNSYEKKTEDCLVELTMTFEKLLCEPHMSYTRLPDNSRPLTDQWTPLISLSFFHVAAHRRPPRSSLPHPTSVAPSLLLTHAARQLKGKLHLPHIAPKCWQINLSGWVPCSCLANYCLSSVLHFPFSFLTKIYYWQAPFHIFAYGAA